MMKYLKYTLIILTMLCLLIFLTTKVYFHYDVPEYSGTQPLSFLKDTVEVYTDSFGMPYVFAENNEDLFFTSGYLIARERLFQLSILVAVMHGEISTLLGDEYIEHDNYIKQKDMFSIINDNIVLVGHENLKLIEAYCSGINAWINESEKSLPLSFKILNKKPIEWTAVDAVNALSVMTNNIAKNNRETYIQKEIKQYLGEIRYNELVNNEDEQFILTDSISIESLKLENEILALIGASGSQVGSNVTIVPGVQNESRKPILIFEDIWDLQQPTKWYDIHLKGGDYNLEGAMILGFPIPLIGKTNSSTWAFSGELRQNDINSIFDLAKNSTNVSKIANLSNSISYADTSGYYFESSRNANRFAIFKEELNEYQSIKIDDIKRLSAENKNQRKAEIAALISDIYFNNNYSSHKLVEILSDWNGNISSNSAEVLLINTIYSRLMENIFRDEMSLIGNDIYSIFSSLPRFVENSMENVLTNTESSWIDDIGTINYKETLSDIVVKSVDEALSIIIKKYGDNIANWQMSTASSPSFKHVLGRNKLINYLFNLNVGQISEVSSTSNIDEFRIENGNKHNSGTAIWKIYDLSDMNQSYTILPTGQSGLPKSIHYTDQTELFNNYDFRKIEFDETTIRSSGQYQKLTLYPNK